MRKYHTKKKIERKRAKKSGRINKRRERHTLTLIQQNKMKKIPTGTIQDETQKTQTE